jgi:type IV secretory pathway VirB6-like protein
MKVNLKRIWQSVLSMGSKSSLIKLASLSLLLSLLTACPAPGPECIDADDWGDKIKATLNVQAKDEYTPVGIRVDSGTPVSVEISGLIDICPDDTTFKSVAQPVYDKAGKLEKTILPIDASKPIWQRAGVTIPKADGSGTTTQYMKITKGTKFSIKISGNYNDREGKQESGKGLYVYIGDKTPPASDTVNTGAQGNWWYGAQGAPQPEDNKKTGDKAAYPEFFELWDNGTIGEGGGFSGIARADGYLWFKYARTASAEGLDNNGGKRYSPWLGRYAWNDPVRCELCRQTVIPATCAVTALAAGPFWAIAYAACYGAWETGCAASGHLEEAASLLSPSGRYCREPYNGDHWVDNNYDGSERDKGYKENSYGNDENHPNSGGYDISIGIGCLGTYGKYMDMDIGSSSAYLVDKTDPEGCVVGVDNPCEQVKGQWGEIIKVPKYKVSASSSTSMDMREFPDGQNKNGNPGFVRTGVYRGKLAANGELWFHIKDDATSMSHPDKGYYDDNQGNYTVKVTTSKVNSGFSDAMDSLINPIRGVIFGYCRNTQNPELKYKLTESECGDYVDYNGNTVPAWLPGVTQRMFTHIVSGTVDPSTGKATGNPFLSALRAALVLYVIVYAGLFMMGMVQDKQEEFLKRIIRFAIVAVLLTENSWDFFNNYLFTLFYNGVDNFIGMMATQFTGAAATMMVDPVTGATIPTPESAGASSGHIFAFADITINKFFQWETIVKVFGLTFTSPIGFLYVILIFVGMFYFLFALIQALILYLLAMLAISLLLIVAPIFLSFMLFERTRPLFDSWVKNLINYTLQPVLVFTALSIFNIFVYTAIYTLLNYRVCWTNVWWLDIGASGASPLVHVPLINFYMPDNPVTGASVPIQLFMILIFIIICNAMLHFIDWMAEMAAEMTTTVKGTALSKQSAKVLNGAIDTAKAIATAGVSAAAKSAAIAGQGAVQGAKSGGKEGGYKGAARGAIKGAGTAIASSAKQGVIDAVDPRNKPK